MTHLQYLPGDPRLVDQLVCELKSKGIFDQFRKECIADVDTRPAYQNLRQRVETSVATFLSRQVWKPDLNKNQLREKLRKHLLDGNYLEQGVERIVDQVVNPKVASVFIPQVEDLVYNFLGIARKKCVVTPDPTKENEKDLLPNDLEAVSPGSVKSNDDIDDAMDINSQEKEEPRMDVEESESKNLVIGVHSVENNEFSKLEESDSHMSVTDLVKQDSNNSLDKCKIPLPKEEIKLENIPEPKNSPPKCTNVELKNILLPKEPHMPTDIPLPNEALKTEKDHCFKPIELNSDDDDSSSDSSLIRNMSPLTPIRNYNNENSCDAQQAFDNDAQENKSENKPEISSFKFAIESKSPEHNTEDTKLEKKEAEQVDLSYQFNNQVTLNSFNTTACFDDSSNSHNLQIDYESDVNSKMNIGDTKQQETEDNKNHEDVKKEQKPEEKKSHKSSHRSRDSHRHSSSNKDRRSDSKHSSSKERRDSKQDKKPKDDHSKSKSSTRERSRERSDKKGSRDSSRYRSSSHKSSKDKESKSQTRTSSSSSGKHSISKQADDKRSSLSNNRDKIDKSSERSSKDKSNRDSKNSSSHRSDKARKSSSSNSSKSKNDDKDKQKKDKKDTDDHYSLSGRGNHHRRSTDRDSNDGSSSSKGSNNQTNNKTTESKSVSKNNNTKSDNTSSGTSSSPSDKDNVATTDNAIKEINQPKPIRVETHLEVPISSPPRLPFVPDITMKKPKIAANLEEAKKLMKMRKFLDEEQKRMNQEAALLLEFQANVRPSLSQVYSSIPGPELEFACVVNNENRGVMVVAESNSTEPLVVDMKNIDKPTETVLDNEQSKVNQDILDSYQESVITNVTNDSFENFVAKAVSQDIVEVKEPDLYINIQDDESAIDKEKDLIEHVENNVAVSRVPDDILKKEENESKNIKNEKEQSLKIIEDKDEIRKRTEFYEVTIITEELSEDSENEEEKAASKKIEDSKSTHENKRTPKEEEFKYFSQQNKHDAEIKREQFYKFFEDYNKKIGVKSKIYLINCDSYGENIINEEMRKFGEFEIVNYHKNGYLKAKNVVKNVNVSAEVTLPVDSRFNSSPVVFSPVKSEYSFELSSDYDAKLEEMVNKTSRQEIMEIILGAVTEESTSHVPHIDYCTESNIDETVYLKRKMSAEGIDNNNENVLSSNKLRKLSGSDQITSTTEETDEIPNNRVTNNMKSKYLGKARRVGLPKPKKSNVSSSPSSDKSVENYDHIPKLHRPNGKLKTVRNKVQRYDTSDLYKPKLHYLSRRNNIS